MAFLTRFCDLPGAVARMKAYHKTLLAEIESCAKRLEVARRQAAKPSPPRSSLRERAAAKLAAVAKSQLAAQQRVTDLTAELQDVRRVRQELATHRAHLDQAIAECLRVERLQ